MKLKTIKKYLAGATLLAMKNFRVLFTMIAFVVLTTGSAPNRSDIVTFLEQDKTAKVLFYGNETAELFSKEIETSFAGALKHNFKTDRDTSFIPGFISASIKGRPWHDTMWTRDGGTFMRELVLWGNINHASLLSDCLIKMVEKNEEGYYTFPEYFKYTQHRSGHELDGTSSIIIGMALLWQRLPNDSKYRRQIYEFLHDEYSPLQYIVNKLKDEPLIAGSGEFGGGCYLDGMYYNVVQNNLVRIALSAGAEIERSSGQNEMAEQYEKASEKIRANMKKYLVDDDGTWIWAINPAILKPDSLVLNHVINKGFTGINGVGSMYSDWYGLQPLSDNSFVTEISKNTFEKSFEFPLRKSQFEKYGIYTQFDEFSEGLITSAYGHSYGLQFMILFDRLEMADKALEFLASATFNPPGRYTSLERESPYYFYERYYSPEIKADMEQGCGALNLVNVTEPIKAARLIVGVDDHLSDTITIIPRIPPSWKGYKVSDWPIKVGNELVRADIQYEQSEESSSFFLDIKSNVSIPVLKVRLKNGNDIKWIVKKNTNKIKI